MKLGTLRELFQQDEPEIKPYSIEVPLKRDLSGNITDIQQPAMKDARGTLIKVRADKSESEVIEELRDLALDLGWDEDCKISATYSGRSRGALKNHGFSIRQNDCDKSIVLICSDPVAITYAVPSHKDYQDDQETKEIKRFLAIDPGVKDEIAAVAMSLQDGTIHVERTDTHTALWPEADNGGKTR